MPKFPKSEPQIMALVYRMVIGYTAHRADFPRVPPPSRMKLFFKGREYLSARQALIEARAKLQIASKIKSEKLSELKSIMTRSLQKAQVDTTANPEKLKLIGWDVKSASKPTRIPEQPTNLIAIHKQDRVVDLKWKKPVNGGAVGNYVIERSCLNANQSNRWTFTAISYDCRINLTNQPKGILLEYHVRASNHIGQSSPSNSVTIRL